MILKIPDKVRVHKIFHLKCYIQYCHCHQIYINAIAPCVIQGEHAPATWCTNVETAGKFLHGDVCASRPYRPTWRPDVLRRDVKFSDASFWFHLHFVYSRWRLFTVWNGVNPISQRIYSLVHIGNLRAGLMRGQYLHLHFCYAKLCHV